MMEFRRAPIISLAPVTRCIQTGNIQADSNPCHDKPKYNGRDFAKPRNYFQKRAHILWNNFSLLLKFFLSNEFFPKLAKQNLFTAAVFGLKKL
jgi:hypothetical protein